LLEALCTEKPVPPYLFLKRLKKGSFWIFQYLYYSKNSKYEKYLTLSRIYFMHAFDKWTRNCKRHRKTLDKKRAYIGLFKEGLMFLRKKRKLLKILVLQTVIFCGLKMTF